MIAFLLGAAAGYVFGTRAGRARYEQIVRMGRRVAGSQTVQSAAGVFQAQVEDASQRAREVLTTRRPHKPATGSNGHHR